MERNCAASGQVAILQLDLAEIRGLHSFLALGAHYFRRHSPFSPDETRSLVAPVGASLSKTLINSRKQSPLCAIESGYQSCLRGTDRGRGDPEPVARGA